MTAAPAPACEHPEFSASVEVVRLTVTEGAPVSGFTSNIHVSCSHCGEPFEWIGLPVGLSPRFPAASVDGQELRAPLRPVSAPPGFGEFGPGFHVTMPEVRR